MPYSPGLGQERSDVNADVSAAAEQTKWVPGLPICQAHTLATVGITVCRKADKVEGCDGDEKRDYDGESGNEKEKWV